METTVVDTIRKSIRKTPDFILLQKLLLLACTHTNNEIATSPGCYFCCGCCAIANNIIVSFPMDHRDHIKCMEHLSELQHGSSMVYYN